MGESPSSAGMLFTPWSRSCVTLQGQHPQDEPKLQQLLGPGLLPAAKPGLFQPRETRFPFSLITPDNLPLSLYSLYLLFF